MKHKIPIATFLFKWFIYILGSEVVVETEFGVSTFTRDN